MNSIKAQTASDLRTARAFLARTLRTGKVLAFTPGYFPLWLRILYILGVQAWCPLPIDEVFLLVALGITVCVPSYRRNMARAWADSAPAALCTLSGCDCMTYAG